MTLSTLIAEKEKEFDRTFEPDHDLFCRQGRRETKSFLSSSMREAVEAFVGELEWMKMVNTKEESTPDWFYGFGYNSALSDIQAKAQEFLK